MEKHLGTCAGCQECLQSEATTGEQCVKMRDCICHSPKEEWQKVFLDAGTEKGLGDLSMMIGVVSGIVEEAEERGAATKPSENTKFTYILPKEILIGDVPYIPQSQLLEIVESLEAIDTGDENAANDYVAGVATGNRLMKDKAISIIKGKIK